MRASESVRAHLDLDARARAPVFGVLARRVGSYLLFSLPRGIGGRALWEPGGVMNRGGWPRILVKITPPYEFNTLTNYTDAHIVYQHLIIILSPCLNILY